MFQCSIGKKIQFIMKVVNFSGLNKCLWKNLWQTSQQLSRLFRVNQSGEPTNMYNLTFIQTFLIRTYADDQTYLLAFSSEGHVCHIKHITDSSQRDQMKISHGKQIVSTPPPQTDS